MSLSRQALHLVSKLLELPYILSKSVKQDGARLSAGVGISAMPAFENVLTDTEIAATLAYIKSTWPTGILAAQAQR